MPVTHASESSKHNEGTVSKPAQESDFVCYSSEVVVDFNLLLVCMELPTPALLNLICETTLPLQEGVFR